MGSNKPETKNNNLLPTVIQTKGPEVQIPVVPLSFLSLSLRSHKERIEPKEKAILQCKIAPFF